MTTYAKLRNGTWGLRGTELVSGTEVVVTKRDGTKKNEIVGRIIWSGSGIVLATISSSRRVKRQSICRSCGHNSDMCAEQDCTCRDCGGMLG